MASFALRSAIALGFCGLACDGTRAAPLLPGEGLKSSAQGLRVDRAELGDRPSVLRPPARGVGLIRFADDDQLEAEPAGTLPVGVDKRMREVMSEQAKISTRAKTYLAQRALGAPPFGYAGAACAADHDKQLGGMPVLFRWGGR